MDYRIAIASQLSKLLKSFRKQSGMTQGELGQKLGISQRSVAQFEAHPEKAKFERVLQVLSVLDVDLVLRERKPSKPNEGSTGDVW